MRPSVDVDVDEVDVDNVDVGDVDVHAVDVDDFDFEAMPRKTLNKFSKGSPAMRQSVEVDVDSVDVDDFEVTHQKSNGNCQAIPEQETAPTRNTALASSPSKVEISASEKTVTLGESVVDAVANVNEPTQQISTSATGLPLATEPALNANNSLSKRNGMQKSVSFATVVSTVSADGQEMKEKEKKVPRETTEETTAPATGETVPQSKEESAPPTTGHAPPNEDSESSPKHLLAPVAPGEDMVAADTRSISVGKDSSWNLLEGEEDGASSKDNQNKSSIPIRSDRPRRVPMAEMNPAERKAKQKAVLLEAKLAAEKVRQENKSKPRRSRRSHGEEGSVVSNTSSLTHDGVKHMKRGFFKNPFTSRSKASDANIINAHGGSRHGFQE
jgi:hypothetical protein